jgi:hypothetical protein
MATAGRGGGPPAMRSICHSLSPSPRGCLLTDIQGFSLRHKPLPGVSTHVRRTLDALATMSPPSAATHLCEVFQIDGLREQIMTGSVSSSVWHCSTPPRTRESERQPWHDSKRRGALSGPPVAQALGPGRGSSASALVRWRASVLCSPPRRVPPVQRDLKSERMRVQRWSVTGTCLRPMSAPG